MDFLLGIMVGIGIGFLWGVWRATQSFIERIVNSPEEIKELMTKVQNLEKEAQTEIQKTSVVKAEKDNIKLEIHEGICYLYDQNDKFLAQGSTVSEAMDNAERRFPNLKLNFRLNVPEQN